MWCRPRLGLRQVVMMRRVEEKEVTNDLNGRHAAGLAC
jgi:hypothetical protein